MAAAAAAVAAVVAATNQPFNPTAANVAAVASSSVWPSATTYALNQWPPQRDFTKAAAYCAALGKRVCDASTLGFGDARWKAGNGAYINGAWLFPNAFTASPAPLTLGLPGLSPCQCSG
jgi:hypothetical protein